MQIAILLTACVFFFAQFDFGATSAARFGVEFKTDGETVKIVRMDAVCESLKKTSVGDWLNSPEPSYIYGEANSDGASDRLARIE